MKKHGFTDAVVSTWQAETDYVYGFGRAIGSTNPRDHVRDGTGRPGQILTEHDLLMQWPNEISPEELTRALEFACHNGWLSQTAIGFELTHAGLADA